MIGEHGVRCACRRMVIEISGICMRETDNSGSFEFLLAELDRALNSIDAAITSQRGRDTFTRSVRSARQVYDDVVRLVRNVPLDPASHQTLDNKLAALRIRLQAAGETV